MHKGRSEIISIIINKLKKYITWAVLEGFEIETELSLTHCYRVIMKILGLGPVLILAEENLVYFFYLMLFLSSSPYNLSLPTQDLLRTSTHTPKNIKEAFTQISGNME